MDSGPVLFKYISQEIARAGHSHRFISFGKNSRAVLHYATRDANTSMRDSDASVNANLIML